MQLQSTIKFHEKLHALKHAVIEHQQTNY